MKISNTLSFLFVLLISGITYGQNEKKTAKKFVIIKCGEKIGSGHIQRESYCYIKNVSKEHKITAIVKKYVGREEESTFEVVLLPTQKKSLESPSTNYPCHYKLITANYE